MDATIIAGLLILMTIQSTISISPTDMLLEGKTIEKKLLATKEFSDKIAQSFEEKNWKLDNRTADFIINEMYKTHLESELYLKKMEIYDELGWWEKILLSPSYPANIIIIPFAISALIELASWTKFHSESPSRIGIYFAYAGFGVMLTVFFTNFIIPYF